MRRQLMGIIALLVSGIAPAQNTKVWSLSECIDRAIEVNIDVQLSSISQEQNAINYQQSRWNLSPDLNFNGGQFYQSGRSIDRFSNQFVQETVGNSSVQLQSSWVVFAGGSLRQAVTRNAKLLKASEYDKQQTQQNIALSVALAYLQCLQAKELLTANELNIATLAQDEKRIATLFQLGAMNEGLLLSAKAQVAQARVQKIQTENQLKTSLLNLKNLLRIPYQEGFDIAYSMPPAPEYLEYPVPLITLLDSALNRRADYKAALLQTEASEVSIKMARAQLMPVISIGGSLSSIYSDKAQNITGYQMTGSRPIGYVSGSNEIVEAPVFSYQTRTIDFSHQMRDNFGQSFGANIGIPIFGKFKVQNEIKMAKLSWSQQQLAADRIKQNAITEISNAYQSFRNAAMAYQSQRENHEAQMKNLEFTQKRYENGQATFFEVQLAKNQELMAFQSFLSNKYEAAMRHLILDVLYQGNFQLIKP